MGSSFMAMLSIAAFLVCAWFATKISRVLGISAIVLEITTGILLGPSVVGLISEEYAICGHKRHTNCHAPVNTLELAIAGKSLGDDLDDIAEGKACERHHYEPWRSQGYPFVGELADEGDEAADLHAGDSHVEEDGEATHDHGDQHAEGAEEAGSTHDESNSEASTVDDEPMQPDGGHHRRLSGIYKSYQECLVRNCEAEVAQRCQTTPSFFTLIGHTGVALMIFESGMHFDFEKASVVGPKACAVAVVGTILPLITGSLLMVIYGKPFMPDGLSVGTALAPTSVGIALRLLGEAQVLQEDVGQAIVTAAFVNDILSLVLFNVLFSLRGEFSFLRVVLFPVIGVVFMGVAMLAAVKFWPNFINNVIMSRIPEKADAKVSPRDEVLFMIMMSVLLLYTTATYFLGSHLWGCFIAGLSFACIDKHHWPHQVWVRQTKRATSWMIRIFFAATVAFAIPVDTLFSLDAFLKGSLMGLGPCILTKVLCAPFMGSAKFVIGFAMVGRAEFAYLIAQMAAAGNMMDPDTFSIVIWALLYATIFAPILFRKVLDRYVRLHLGEAALKDESDGEQEEVVVHVQ